MLTTFSGTVGGQVRQVLLYFHLIHEVLSTYRQRSLYHGIFNCTSIGDCKIVFCSREFVMNFLFSGAFREALRSPSPYFYVWELSEWGHETNRWTPSSAVEVKHEWSCKFFHRVISWNAQVKLYFTFRDALSILSIEQL